MSSVLLGCEESGVGRRAFADRGMFATSVDILPSRDIVTNSGAWPLQQHLVADIISFLKRQRDGFFDLAILHPPCTALCLAGNRHYSGTKERDDAIAWTLDLWELTKKKAKRVCLENPAGVIWKVLREHGATVQWVHPWQFGHPEQKKTGLGLWNLPKLQPTHDSRDLMHEFERRHRERVFFTSPSEERSRLRSTSYSGMLEAMAKQWGPL